MRQIVCENEDGMAVNFGSSFSPFLLENCDGLYDLNVNVSTSDNTMTDGATYLGSVVKPRNIVLTLRDKTGADHQKNRAVLYDLFKTGSEGNLVYTENDTSREISYYVESLLIDGVNRARQATVSLLCPDPYFYAVNESNVTMASYDAQFEFPHEFLSGGEELGAKNTEKLKTIENTGAVGGIGLTIVITAAGPVTNPSVTHVENAEAILLGTEEKPLELQLGDTVIITTATGNKHVYLVSGGVQREINEYLDESSVFIQLSRGKNTFGYTADDGADDMTVEISYRYKYLGV